ncbi:unnamed protein product [Echinostoma caproni]|uniref:Poly [ADP-ribose] polymerase n=1 Tax=Echinostoma caproni TaxID=27848 RepID=A0A183AIY6_9TREM|nr:unnamed protein product [Echinostoma caproni]
MIVEGDAKSGKLYHLSCFIQSGQCPSEINTLKGFQRLKKVDQQAVLLAQEETKKENKKRPAPDSADAPVAKKSKVKKEEESLQDALKTQSRLLWKLHDDLEREVSKDALVGLLEYNEQFVPTGLSNLLDAVSDAMLFGALAPCPTCKNSSLRYTNGQYKCTAMATEWAACLYSTREPVRVPFKVPKEYHDVDFLRKYKYKERKRLFAPDSDIKVLQNKPFANRTVYVVNGSHQDGKTKEQLSEELKVLGATISSKFVTPGQEDVMRVKFKGGAVVDPESGLDTKATVMRDSRGTPMTAVLGMVDLVKGCNSFYRLQALKQDTGGHSFWVFRAWGRIGTTIGGTKLEKFTTESAARQNFEAVYLEKTGNEWRNRDRFEKVPHRFYEMELDYGDTLLLGESTRFYTLIPHDFGMKTPPLLDNRKMIKTKLQMLEDLREIELAYSILKQGGTGDEHPADQHYRQLKTNLRPMDKTSEEFARIQQYVSLTHAATHSNYKLQVLSVFDVERADEKARFESYRGAQHNRQLLWHGSRRTNWVGIL